MPPAARVVLLAGPSGSGKTHLAAESGLPVLELDDFYRDGTDPGLPRDPTLGIVDWDDPRSWDADAAVAAIEELCRTRTAQVPVYDIAHDGRVGFRRFEVAAADVFVATGIFATEVLAPCRERGLLADAIVVRRAGWKNFLRRLWRDLREHRKPAVTLVRRGIGLWRQERAFVERHVRRGCRPLDRRQTIAALSRHAVMS